MDAHQQLVELEPIQWNKEEIEHTYLNTCIDKLFSIYLARMDLTIDQVISFEKEWNQLCIPFQHKKKTSEIKKAEQYAKRFIKLLHQVYGYQDRSIIAFLVYVLKTPILLLDDPVYEKTFPLIKGCSHEFVQEFVKCTPEERLEFIASCYELGVNFNSFFSSRTEEWPVLEFNLVDYCKKYRDTIVYNPTVKSVEHDIKSNFAFFFQSGDEKDTIQLIQEYANKKYQLDIQSFAKQIVHDMCQGPRDKIINARLNQLKYCKEIFTEERYQSISDSIEESTLNRIHDLLSIQKAVSIHPDKLHSKMVKNIKKMIKKRERSYCLQRKHTFLDVESYNRVMLYQMYYKHYKKEIEKMIQQYPTIFKQKGKHMSIQEGLPFIQQEVLKYTICPETYKFFQIYADFFSNNLTYCPVTQRNEDSVYSLFSDDLEIVPEKTNKIEYHPDFKHGSKRRSFSELFIELNESSVNESRVDELLEDCGFKIDTTSLYTGKKDIFRIELLHYLSKRYLSTQSAQKESESILFWVLLRPYLGIDEEYHYYIRDSKNRPKGECKEYGHYFGSPIKHIMNATGKEYYVYRPTNQFWKEQSCGHKLDCFTNIHLGVYHPKKNKQFLKDFSEEEMKKVQEYIQTNKKEHKKVQLRAKEQIPTEEWLDKCKQFLFQKCQPFYREKDSKRNCMQDCQYWLDGIHESLQTSNISCEFFIKKCAMLCILLDKYDSPFYSCATSFQTSWLQSTEKECKDMVHWDTYHYLPELMIMEDRQKQLQRFSQLETSYFTECFYYCEQTLSPISPDESEVNLFQFELNPYSTLGESLFYTVSDTGQVTCYTKEDVFKTIRGELEYKGHKQLEEMCKEFLCFNPKNPMSMISYIQALINQYIIENKSESIQLALDITNYIRGKMVRYSDLNEVDKHRSQAILTFSNDAYLNDIALDYLVRYSVEYYRQIVCQEIESYIHTNKGLVDTLRTIGYKLVDLYSEQIESAQADYLEWSKLVYPIITSIETKCGINCTEQQKKQIYDYIGLSLQLPQYDIYLIRNKECSVCKQTDVIPIRTITIHKEENGLVDKQQQFCSIECMDIHLASAPTPTEEDMEQLELRSYIRDMIKHCYPTIESCKQIAIQSLHHSISVHLKEVYKLQPTFPMLSIHLLPEKERRKAYLECNMICSATSWNIRMSHFQTLLKQICTYKEPISSTYYITQTMNLMFRGGNTEFERLVEHTYPITSFPYIQDMLTVSFERLEDIKEPKCTLTTINSERMNTLLDNQVFQQMYESVIEECTEKSLSSHQSEYDSEYVYYMDKKISLSLIEDWIQKKYNDWRTQTREIDIYTDLMQPFSQFFKLQFPTKDDFSVYYKCLHSIQMVRLIVYFLLDTKQTTFSSFKSWLTTYIVGECNVSFDVEEEIEECIRVLTTFSSNAIPKNSTTEDCFKTIQKHITSHLKYKKYKRDELCNDILSYFNCDWDELMKRCKEGLYLIHTVYYYYIVYVCKENKIQPPIDIIEGESITVVDLPINTEDNDLDIWEKQVDMLTPDTLHKFVTTTNQNSTTFSSIRDQFNTELLLEKETPAKVKHMYNALVNAMNEDELITVFETFLPEEFDENTVNEIIDCIENKKCSRKEIYDKIRISLQL